MSSRNSQPTVRIVLKFGGSSVSSRSGWETIAELLVKRMGVGERILLVHSALTGVTDALDRLANEAVARRHESSVAALDDRHVAFASELGLDPDELLAQERDELARSAEGIALTGEATPRIRARLLSLGERLSTRLGAAFLRSLDIAVEWLPATDLLDSKATDRQTGDAIWLSAECDPAFDPRVRERLDAIEGVALTQGYLARGPGDETVVLGRGGSDTAAAYLAGRWGADRVEIWSDVPGMFSADPRVEPSARLLRRLDYREAQEIATTGSKVLHPRAVRALRDREIPLHLKSTLDPAAPNTVIERTADTGPAQVKAISSKEGIVLVSMETLGMWNEVGFLARAFGVFRDHGLSIDLVSTSETNVTVSLDPEPTLMDPRILAATEEALASFCRTRVIRSCAAVSVVGSRIRAMLHRMGPALETFEERRIHLVSQAASDLNFTVVVDEEDAPELVARLHALLIPPSGTDSDVFGPSWTELAGTRP